MNKQVLLLALFTLFLSQIAISQTSFQDGFQEGYNSTIRDAGLEGYSSGDSRLCQTDVYSKNQYADGYRCGVQQATKEIPNINKRLKSEQNQRNRENIKNNPQLDGYIKSLEQSKEQDQYNIEQNNANNSRQEQNRIENVRLADNRAVYDQQVLYQMQQKQIQSQRAYQREISDNINSLSSSMQAASYNMIKNELDRRASVATNFAQANSSRIEKVNSLYNQIPSSNFSKNINGQYSAHLFLERKYSFINNKELVKEIPCLVKVENNKVINIYPYGKKGFELDYPKIMSSASYLSNGIVKYTDFNTLETATIVLIEPYLSNDPKQYRVTENKTGFLTLFTSKSKDEGRIVWIQEIDGKGNIVREVSTPLIYAKNEDELAEMNIAPMPFNTGNELYYFGEPAQTPYGKIPFFMKTSKSDTKGLDDNENRFVEIKKYRD